MTSGAAGDGGDDADFVFVGELGVDVFEEADVFAVHVDVDEAADLAGFIAKALAEARVLLLEAVDSVLQRRAVGGDELFVVGELAERSGDADLGHCESSDFSFGYQYQPSTMSPGTG